MLVNGQVNKLLALVAWFALAFGLGDPLGARAENQLIFWGDDSALTNVPAGITNSMAIAGGNYHALALQRDGTVLAWGRSYLATGMTLSAATVPTGLTNVVSIATGAAHSLALRRDRTVALWGTIYYGANAAFRPSGIASEATNVVALAPGSGAEHALVLRADGTVVDWGSDSSSLSNAPAAAKHIVSVAAGSVHALALRADGRVVSWGKNVYGGYNISGLTNVPAIATNIVAIAAGVQYNAALRADGTVLFWDGGYPFTAPGLTGAIDISCAVVPGSLVALKRNGTVFSMRGSVPAYATNLVAITGSSYENMGLVGSGAPVFPGLTVDRTVVSGVRAYFRALAVGALPLTYQWSYNGTNIPGATNTVLVVTNAQPSHMGAYCLTASNALGVAVSSNMLLNVLPVEITREPQGQLQYVGGTASFSVVAEGQGPLNYQWRHDGNPLPGATNATLVITNAQPEAAGEYAVVVSNIHGAATSQSATLLLQPILITSRPASQTLVVGTNVGFSIFAAGQSPLSYQWQCNGTNLLQATNSTLILPDTKLADTGVYTVVISNLYGVTNSSFSLSVVPTIITGLPKSQTIFPGGTVAFGINVQAAIPLAYQWKLNDLPIADATSNLLTITNVQYHQAGVYEVTIKDAYETVTKTAGLAVVPVAVWGSDDQSDVPWTMTNIVACSSGSAHALVLTAEGTVIGWGKDAINTTTPPPGLTNVIAIAAGNGSSAALRDDGTVVTWGLASFGVNNVPGDLTNAVAISAGSIFNLALKNDGTVAAWGDNSDHQTNVPSGLTNVVSVAAGQGHGLALRADGTVVAWGDNTDGQCNVPAGLTNVIQIAAGGVHSLALTAQGLVIGWGVDFYNETIPPAGLSNVVAIAAGFDYSVALKADGTVVVWGSDTYNVTMVPSGLSNIVAVAANNNNYGVMALVGNSWPVRQAQVSNMVSMTNGFALSIPSQSGRTFRLEYKSSLADPDWKSLPLVAGRGGVLTLVDSTATNNAQRYYRVRRW